MPRLPCLFLPIIFAGLLAGCQFQRPGAGSGTDDVTPNAVTGEAIEVTALDGAAPEEGAAPPPAAEDTAKPQSAPPPAPVEEPVAEVVAEPAPQPDLAEVVPEEAKSDRQIACEKKKGQWVKAEGAAYTCIFTTGDAGKSCTRGSQCEGECLARSGTCSPIKPLLGCNEILQDDGARVTMCIE